MTLARRGRSSGDTSPDCASPLSQSSTIGQWSYRLLKVEIFDKNRPGQLKGVDLAKPSTFQRPLMVGRLYRLPSVKMQIVDKSLRLGVQLL
jgi:hypothetical protein